MGRGATNRFQEDIGPDFTELCLVVPVAGGFGVVLEDVGFVFYDVVFAVDVCAS